MKRNKLAEKMLKETPQEVKDKVSDYANKLLLNNVSKCACPPLIACEICGEKKNLDGDFWKNKKNHGC